MDHRLLRLVTILWVTPTWFIASSVEAADKSKVKRKKIKSSTSESDSTDGAVKASTSEFGGSQSVRATRSVGGGDVLFTPASDFALNYGVSGRYQLKPDLGLELVYLTGNTTVSKSEGDSTANAKISGMAAYAGARYFLGNSFNASAGLGLRTATISYVIDMPSVAITLNGKIDVQSVVVPIFVGNRWTFPSGFTIGCDWIGAFIAVSGSAKSTLDGNIPNDTAKSLNQTVLDLGTELSHKTSLTLLLTSIGWSF